MPPSTQAIAAALADLHRVFAGHGLWHCLTYGTLLGAVRQGGLIPWDYDFDLFVRPSDVQAIEDVMAPAPHGLTVARVMVPGASLAVNPERIDAFWGSQLGCYKDGEKVGDLYAFSLFDDGVLRRFDLAQDTYWCPHSSFPHYFVERLDEATLGGEAYPVPQHAGTFLAGVYGRDWRVPYRAVTQGGTLREGTTTHGDRYEPKLLAEIEWCLAQDWDRSRYAGELAWPRPIRAAGPLGPTPRTEDSSRALWWRSLDELQTLY